MIRDWMGAAAAAVLAAAAVPAVAQTAKDTLTIGMSQSPPNLNPGIEPTVAKTYVERIAYRPITGYDADWHLHCFLCTEVPTLENGRAKVTDLGGGKRGLDVRFSLLPDAKWADGTPITSKDVAFTWTVGSKKDIGFAKPSVFDRISSVEAVDDKTFVLHMNKAEYDFADLTDFSLLPAHLEEPVVKALTSPADYTKQTTYNREPTNPGLWNGPYKLAQMQSGAFFVFEPNPNWWGPKPAFKRVTVKVIENTATLEANLKSGDIDFISGELGMFIDQGLAMQKQLGMSDKYTFLFPPGVTYEHIDLNLLTNPLLKDKRVRQGLLYGIDRDTLVQQLFEGKWPVANSWVNPKDPGFDPSGRKYAYDPDKAKSLFEAAGFKPGADGIRVDAQGRRLSFELMTTAGNKLRELVEQVLQSQWKDVGVEIAIKNEPARTYFGETLKKHKFTGLGLYAWTSAPESPPAQTLSTTYIPTDANNFGGANYPGFSNPEMDKLIADIQGELDPAKRKPMWVEMQKIYTEEVPVLPLYFRTDVFIIPKWLKGVTPTGHDTPSTAFIENWRAG